MRFRWEVEHSPKSEPKESQRSGDHKRGSPAAEVFVEADDQQRSDCAANGRATIEKRNGPAAFFFRKPFRDRFGRRRPICGFTGPEQKTKERKAAQSNSKRR